MELAIPLIALGSMYIASNQQPNQICNDNTKEKNGKNDKKEKFTNMGKSSNYLPNVNIPVQNFPISNSNQKDDSIQSYPNPNVATDKYFSQNMYEQNVRNGNIHGNKSEMKDIHSLNGNYLKSEQFKHNNMVPFNGGKVKGNTYNANVAESVLDNMNGTGTHVIKKVEQAPLFKPQDNVNWTYGAPNQNDFYQSRVNPAIKNNNVKPFESVMVGPGLDKGYGTTGSGGYNSGLESRDKWLPKTIDQMRVATNPKLEYDLINHEGPAYSVIKNSATSEMIGRVEKQRPDTYFENTQDRWLRTTGSEKGETQRPIQETGIIRRNDILSDYTGPAGSTDVKAGYAPENFEQPKRNEVIAGGINHSSAAGKGCHKESERFLRSHTNYENHRSTLKQPDAIRSGFSGAVGAVIAPLMDILRPTRKDETINNVRVYGEAGTNVPKSYVVNSNDTTATTVKETTLYSPTFNINNQKEGHYVNNYTAPISTQRDTTCSEHYSAPGGYATSYGDMRYDAAYKQNNNEIKSSTINNRPNQGGMQIFNQQMNINTTKQDNTRFDGRLNPAISITPLPPSTQTYGSLRSTQYYNESAGGNRNNPDILEGLKNNPYVFSFNSVA